MTFDYARARATATRLIAKFGQDGTIVRAVVSGGGPTDPTGGTQADVEYPAKVAVLPIDARQVGQDIGGTNIRQTDVMIYAQAGIGIVPQPDDSVVCANGTFTVMRCNPLSPAGTDVFFDIVGRK